MRRMLTAPLAAAVSIGFGLGAPALAAPSGGSASQTLSSSGSATATAGATTAGPRTDTSAATAANTGGNNANITASNGNGGACMRNVRAFETKMQQDGYWLNGYNGMGYAFLPPGPAVATGGAANNVGNANNNANGPWGNVTLNLRPGYELRTLSAAADILARRGEQQTCQNVLNSARNIYHHYTAVLARHGVTGPGVANWRRREIALAKPVTQITRNFRIQDITGTDIRTPRDKLIGNVSDVIINPRTGKIAYVIVNYGGGIFGIGSNSTAVPWHDFAATPGLNTLVLNTTQQALQNAPQINPNRFSAGGAGNKMDQEVDAYWQSHLNGGGTPANPSNG